MPAKYLFAMVCLQIKRTHVTHMVLVSKKTLVSVTLAGKAQIAVLCIVMIVTCVPVLPMVYVPVPIIVLAIGMILWVSIAPFQCALDFLQMILAFVLVTVLVLTSIPVHVKQTLLATIANTQFASELIQLKAEFALAMVLVLLPTLAIAILVILVMIVPLQAVMVSYQQISEFVTSKVLVLHLIPAIVTTILVV